MGTAKQYDEEFKKQAEKLAKEIGNKAADELGIPKGTLERDPNKFCVKLNKALPNSQDSSQRKN